MAFSFTNPLDNPDHLDGPSLGGGTVYLANNISVAPGTTTLAQGLYIGGATSLAFNMTFGAAKGAVTLFWDYQNTISGLDTFSEYYPSGSGSIVDLVPVVAPFLGIQVQNGDAVNQPLFLQIASCRATGGPVDFATGRTLIAQAIAVPASSTVNQPVSIVLPGAATLFMSTGLQTPVTVSYAANVFGNGSFITVAGFTITAGLTSNVATVALPSATGQLTVFNGNAAATTVNVALVSAR